MLMLINSLIGTLWSLLIVLFSIPSIIRIAEKRGLYDIPGERSLHKTRIPRIGGVAIFGAFLSSILLFGTIDKTVQYLLAGSLIMLFIGLKDDIEAETSYRKFYVQILAALVLILPGDVRVTSFNGFWGIYELPYLGSLAFTFVLIIGITNAINLIDGLDGLASSIIVTVCGFIAALTYSGNPQLCFIALALAGAHIGFLRYNLKDARIFMGDTGSLVSGFVISFLIIRFIETSGSGSPAIAVALLVIPIFDTLRVFILRILHGRSPFMPDKNHIHHKLLEMGLPSIAVVGILIVVNVAIIVTSLLLLHWGTPRLLLLIIGCVIVLGIVLEVLTSFNVHNEEVA